MKILAIETSCDETSMAIIDISEDLNSKKVKLMIHGHFTASQASLHAEYGGVFPAVAKLEHVKAITPLMDVVFNESKKSLAPEFWQKIPISEEKLEKVSSILYREESIIKELKDFIENNQFPKLDLITVTQGPGLEPALWVGINFARALSTILKIPLIGENHMLGHMYSSLLPKDSFHEEIILNDIDSEFLTLLVSGGHTEIIKSVSHKHELLGSTLDDAIGEAFDKVARLMGLHYPGGPLISKLAEEARSKNIDPIELPRPMLHSGNYEFSYSGLKTAVMYHVKKFPLTKDEDKLALALGFENAAIEVIIKKTTKAMEEHGLNILLLGGGVAANNHLRNELKKASEQNNFTVHYPIMSLTGDNALMVALASGIRFLNQTPKDESDTIKAKGMLSIA